MSKLTSKQLGIVDVHTHAGGIHIYNFLTTQYPTTQDVRDLVLKAKVNRIDQMAVSPMPTPLYYEPVEYVQRQYHPSGIERFPYEVSNKSLLHDTEVFGQNVLLPFMAIHPTEQIGEQLTFLESVASKVYGLKLHTYATNTTATDLIDLPFVDFLDKHNLPILIHSSSRFDFTNAIHILKLADHHPQTRIGIAHLADLDQDVLSRVADFPNLYVDTSPFLSLCRFVQESNSEQVPRNLFDTDYSDPPQCLVDISNAIPGKVVWGTDEPWTAISSYGYSYADERAVLDQLVDKGYEDVSYSITHLNTVCFILGD